MLLDEPTRVPVRGSASFGNDISLREQVREMMRISIRGAGQAKASKLGPDATQPLL